MLMSFAVAIYSSHIDWQKKAKESKDTLDKLNTEEVVARIRERFGDSGWMFVPNTLHLETLYCSEDLAAELRNHPRCLVAESPVPLQFREGRITLFDPLSPANAH